VALLSVGEQSGRLDASFKLLSQYYASRALIIRDTINSLIPTIATIHVFLLIVPLFLLIQFVQGIMFGDYSMCLPFILEKIVVFGLAYGLVILFVFACQGQRGEGWRTFVESISQAVPILRTAQKYLCLSRLSTALEALTSAGVNLVEGWQLAAAASGSPRLRAEVTSWKESLETGATPAELINQSGYFPEMFANLYHTGEISGKLDDSLQRLHRFYQEEGFRTLRVFTRIMVGIIYTALVAVVVYYVFSFYLGRMSTILELTQ
jgi:type II secretory pathway component PulF